MNEVNAPPAICDGDYHGMISYCGVLERNFNRLKSMQPSSEHEMSNSTTMSQILCKFPNTVGEKWSEHIELQDNNVKAKPFPTFIQWLISQKRVWERVAVVEATRGYGTGSLVNTHYVERENTSRDNKCFRCGEEGHKQRFCPKNKPHEKKSKRPKVKKHWCAFHKDDATKHCSSVNCQDLRKADVPRRLQMLKDNRDCKHCCGDHESAKCTKKQRVCGGGRTDRGCGENHAVHELFCEAATVCNVVQQQVMHTQKTQSNQVSLLIMNVKSAKNGIHASVFWDLGSSSNFVKGGVCKTYEI